MAGIYDTVNPHYFPFLLTDGMKANYSHIQTISVHFCSKIQTWYWSTHSQLYFWLLLINIQVHTDCALAMHSSSFSMFLVLLRGVVIWPESGKWDLLASYKNCSPSFSSHGIPYVKSSNPSIRFIRILPFLGPKKQILH